MSSAAPAKLRSGNASRNAVMNAFTSARPRRGACSEYCKRMSAVQSSSTIAGFQVLPQNSVNHRPTMALLSCSFDMMNSFARLWLLDRPADGGMAAGPGANGDATRLLSWKSRCTTLLALEVNSVDAARD